MILICQFCYNDEDEANAEIDKYGQGYWCGYCDGYTYIKPIEGQHRFSLLLEDKQASNTPAPPIHVSLKKQLSLLRYPGGKSKYIPFVYAKMQTYQSRTLASPYAGGASLELALLEAGVVDQLILNDLDVGIYALYWAIKYVPDELIARIQSAKPTHEQFFQSQRIIKSDYEGCDLIEAAWHTIFVNRMAYSGIYCANPLGGRKGKVKDLVSRWNPANLCKRITQIHKLSDKISIHNMDACTFIEEEYWRPNTTLFIDPPYVQKGKQLYRCYYDKEEHVELNVLLDSLHQGMPGADIILCYDNDPLIQQLYIYPTIETVGRIYSI
jgi:DNA adenine methylase